MAKGDTKTENLLDILAHGQRADIPTDNCCNSKTQNYIVGAINRIIDVEEEVERLENNPDVVDIVATYADLQAYDKTQLTDKDVIRVLQDETHDGDSTYYRYNTNTQAFTYIGESKQYTDFVGTDGTTAGTSGLVPAPATTDVDKFLKSDGTWDEAGGGTLYSTLGQNTDGSMTQKATTDMLFVPGYDPVTNSSEIRLAAGNATVTAAGGIAIGPRVGSSYITRVTGDYGIAIGAKSQSFTYGAALGINSAAEGANSVAAGNGARARGPSGIALGYNATSSGFSYGSIAIGDGSSTGSDRALAVGQSASATAKGSVALGYGAGASTQGEVNIGSSDTSYGYNSSNYRLLSGVYPGQNDNDAVNKKQLDDAIAALEARIAALEGN